MMTLFRDEDLYAGQLVSALEELDEKGKRRV